MSTYAAEAGFSTGNFDVRETFTTDDEKDEAADRGETVHKELSGSVALDVGAIGAWPKPGNVVRSHPSAIWGIARAGFSGLFWLTYAAIIGLGLYFGNQSERLPSPAHSSSIVPK
jgi:hypothetical protein